MSQPPGKPVLCTHTRICTHMCVTGCQGGSVGCVGRLVSASGAELTLCRVPGDGAGRSV